MSPFGPFRLREGLSRPVEGVQAEVRGLYLLHQIATASNAWSIEPSEINPLWSRIVSTDGTPVVSIEPMATVTSHLNRFNQHLYIKLDRVLLCILNDENVNCALVDGLITTVLLGEAGWPLSHTPRDLREKSWAANRRRRRSIKSNLRKTGNLFGLPYRAKHLDDFARMQQKMRVGPANQRLANLGGYARKLYVGFGCSNLEVQRHLTLLMDSITPNEVTAYLSQAREPTDALFFAPLLEKWSEQGLSAGFGDDEGGRSWTRIWN